MYGDCVLFLMQHSGVWADQLRDGCEIYEAFVAPLLLSATAGYNGHACASCCAFNNDVHRSSWSMHNGAVLPLSAAPVGRGADGVDAMA
jgi:hypothetical protein